MGVFLFYNNKMQQNHEIIKIINILYSNYDYKIN